MKAHTRNAFRSIQLIQILCVTTALHLRPWHGSSFRRPVTSVWSLSKELTVVPDEMSIERRSLACLDFGVVLDELCGFARTSRGKLLCRDTHSKDPKVISTTYKMVEEMQRVADYLPLSSEMNALSLVDAIENNSSPAEKEELAAFSQDMEQIVELRAFLESSITDDKMLHYIDIAEDLELPTELEEAFSGAFDEEGNLSVEKYPEIRKLRESISKSKARIASTMQSLLQAPDMKEKLEESVVMEIEGRYCLMLKNTYKKGVGIVHGSSNTGRTIYVEPMAVVEPTNELKALVSDLRVEENRILFEMGRTIFAHRAAIRRSVEAAVRVDILRAKAELGRALGGAIPQVGREGCIRCENARHPVLVLKEWRARMQAKRPALEISKQQAASAGSNWKWSGKRVEQGQGAKSESAVVGNRLELDSSSSALVISGPNAGGKTVVLKTCGLFALMVKFSIPLPAQPGSRAGSESGSESRSGAGLESDTAAASAGNSALRVDVFDHVMADIGDLQTVSGDLSTFSGHLLILQQVLAKVTGASDSAVTDQPPGSFSAGTGSADGSVALTVHSLVLLDEVGTGTDPAQGAALAQAVLEAIVDCNSVSNSVSNFVSNSVSSSVHERAGGRSTRLDKQLSVEDQAGKREERRIERASRVMVTTHYQRIKELAAEDSRFRIAAMQFVDSKPTYKMVDGAVGDAQQVTRGISSISFVADMADSSSSVDPFELELISKVLRLAAKMSAGDHVETSLLPQRSMSALESASAYHFRELAASPTPSLTIPTPLTKPDLSKSDRVRAAAAGLVDFDFSTPARPPAVFVDGYNIIGCMTSESGALAENENENGINFMDARDRLINDLGVLGGSTGWWIEVVFDAYKAKTPAKSERVDGLWVTYTSGSETADNYIERRFSELRKDGFTNMVVATDDLVLRTTAGSLGLGYVPANALLADIRSAYQRWEKLEEDLEREQKRPRPRLQDDMTDELKRAREMLQQEAAALELTGSLQTASASSSASKPQGESGAAMLTGIAKSVDASKQKAGRPSYTKRKDRRPKHGKYASLEAAVSAGKEEINDFGVSFGALQRPTVGIGMSGDLLAAMEKMQRDIDKANGAHKPSGESKSAGQGAEAGVGSAGGGEGGAQPDGAVTPEDRSEMETLQRRAEEKEAKWMRELDNMFDEDLD